MIGVDPELLRFPLCIEAVDVPCMIVGSVASMAFGEPRSTLDIDLVIAARPEDAERLISAFDPGRYYLPPVEVIRRELMRSEGTFNIIDGETSLKADIYGMGNDALNRYGFAHRIAISIDNLGDVYVAPPTCVIVGKLRYFSMSRQDKHLRDIRGMLALDTTGMDLPMIDQWAERIGVMEAWRSCRERAGEE